MPERRDVKDLPGAERFAKTVSEGDVYQFAGLTGDTHPVHLNAEYAASQPVGQRIAHGVILIGLMSSACTAWATREGIEIVSYGWDGVRFIKPVYFGDTITTSYAMDPLRAPEGKKHFALADAYNQRGELVGVGQHILYAT
ncbi:Acyl dehydratase [Cryobacterium flavum]|uniref:Dehydratase n=1 Tax=Cryobacterium flavum TaxID=1424659 RepID=A0A4R8UZR2_9MICO|nr:MaoC/PaaZ C-terminal domain-containing protein [Cryobacterium flavum]TFB73613.1 dehydratase [Cryobacterium flavum]SDO32716.1 Acyl dehydratase [Cryobacterium flavum]